MPVEKGQRLKLLKIWEILRQETDEAHPMSSVELLKRLEDIDIKCDRRTLYADIQALDESGYKINCVRRKTNEYFVEHREFSMAEIQILMDAVQAASFVTEEKTKLLVDKIAELAGSRKAEAIKKNVVAFNTVKSHNEDIFGTVAIITQALEQGKKIEYCISITTRINAEYTARKTRSTRSIPLRRSSRTTSITCSAMTISTATPRTTASTGWRR